MPTYTYECKKCSHAQDVFHAMSATPVVKCEKCGGATNRLMGAGSGLIFKGTGFYETDYKSKSGNGGASGDKGKSDLSSESKRDSKAETKSESKSEPKSESKSQTESTSKSGSTGGGDKAA